MSATQTATADAANGVAETMQAMGRQAREAARILRQSQRCVAFTGAGLSTAAGLGDYRGKQGKWTREAQESGPPSYVTEYEALRPTFAHEAVAALVEKGLLEKGQIDRRTNYYQVTQRGRREIDARREWQDQYVAAEA